MLFKKSNNQEEYELVPQSTTPPNNSRLSNPPPPSDSVNEASPKSSSDSDASRVLDLLEDQVDGFEEDIGFKSVFSTYQGNSNSLLKKSCMTFLGTGLLLWIASLIFYSHFSALKAISNLRWHTDLHLQGYNVTLNPYKVDNKNLTMDLYRKNWGVSYRIPVTWLSPKQYPRTGGVENSRLYLTRGAKGSFIIKSIDSEKLHVLFESPKFAYKNTFFSIEEVYLNPAHPYNENTYHIVVTDRQEQWRQLSFSVYWKYSTVIGDFTPIQPKISGSDSIEKLHFVEFSPNGDKIVFGHNHNLYIQDLETDDITQLTTSGSPDIFHGKTDWVYEEEVTGSDRLVWWAPNGETLIYASLNDTLVPSFKLDYYVKNPLQVGATYEPPQTDFPGQYKSQSLVKYPKPGTPNPVFSITAVNVKNMDSTPVFLENQPQEPVFYRGAWIDNSSFLVLTSDRTSEVLTTVLISTNGESKTIQTLNTSQSYGGWVEKMSPPCIIPGKGYVDKVVVDGFVHLAHYASVTDTNPNYLTKSTGWEVTKDSPIVYNSDDNRVYFVATIRSSMDAHLMAVDLGGGDPIPVTDTSKDGSYEVHFSDGGTLLNLVYLGPGPSWQRLVPVAELGTEGSGEKFSFSGRNPINLYDQTQTQLSKTNLPTRNFRSVKIGTYQDGLSLSVNIMEIFPPNFDPKKQHPLLVHAYGGPGSQQVQKGDQFGFLDVISASLNAVILVIDPRGTQGQGWKFKTYARHNIGYYEPRDILTVVSEYISVNKAFLDSTRTAMWGWSYGAFVTLKVLELDAGKTIRYGMAVAPVTNWMFYDSIYTERYLGSPTLSGYPNSTQVTDFANFKNCARFLLVHGTSDDNVHFQNLAWLVDKLNINGVENYDLHYFPDNDHSIHYHNGDTIVYDKLFSWLQNAFEGVFDQMHR